MSDVTAVRRPAQAPAPQTAGIAGRITELKVSGNLMTLDAGLFCLFQQPGAAPAPQDGSGLPGVRISIPPQALSGSRPGAGQGQVTIRGLHDDGWLGPRDGAALVRVSGGPAQILITVYQSPDHAAETAPRLQVVPLAGPAAGAASGPSALATASGGPAPTKAAANTMTGKDIVAHVQRTGDVGVDLGEWLGKPGSGRWVEGFGVTPRSRIGAEDIEYQAVLGRGWLSPWITGGKFCGSRGMALPMLGFNLRLRGKAAEQYDCEYSASFIDGTRIGPLPAGRSCEAPTLSPLEAFRIVLRPRGSAAAAKPSAARQGGARPAVKPPVAKRAPAKVEKPAPTPSATRATVKTKSPTATTKPATTKPPTSKRTGTTRHRGR